MPPLIAERSGGVGATMGVDALTELEYSVPDSDALLPDLGGAVLPPGTLAMALSPLLAVAASSADTVDASDLIESRLRAVIAGDTEVDAVDSSDTCP
mmetsp:Transcript_17983/g.57516  ORF Transcript_17983/g.57516 Transcript_17983/m.57516 type:complete len:97 (+) Transcript_17983:71-361(+)